MPERRADEEMRVLIAGGGTGGHLYPGLAIAEELLHRDQRTQILFVGTRKGLEARVLPQEGYRLKTINVGKLAGRRNIQKIATLLMIPVAAIQSAWIIFRFKPHVVVGVGGYAAGPMGLTAALLGVPTIIHEQNLRPGFTNRALSRFADIIAVSFSDTVSSFPQDKTVVTGNPLRKSFFSQSKEAGGRSGGPATLFIMGGSRGARSINRAVMEAVPLMAAWKEPPRIIHQTGGEDHQAVSAACSSAGLEAEVKPFIHDIARCYRQADLVLARAGATTLAELMAMGKACILVPFPFAAGGHQETNAVALKKAGAAEVMLDEDLNGQLLAGMIKKLFEDNELREDMGKRLASYSVPNAAAKVVELIHSLAFDNSTTLEERSLNPSNPDTHI